MEGQNETGLRKLKKFRSSAKCSITRRIEKLKKENKEENYIKSTGTIESIREKAIEIKNLNNKIWEQMNELQFDDDEEEITTYLEDLEDLIIDYESEIKERKEDERRRSELNFTFGRVRPDITDETVAEKSNDLIYTTEGMEYTKLPPLELLYFDGNEEKWIEFKEQFESTIDKNNNIPTVTKHRYLRSMLRGEAARATEGIPMDAASYSTTKDILERYFGNRKLLIEKIFQKMRNLSANHIRFFSLELNKYVRNLQSLDVNANEYEIMAVPLLVEKLDPGIRNKWTSKTMNIEKPSITDLIQLLEEESFKAHREEGRMSQNNRQLGGNNEDRTYGRKESTRGSSGNATGCNICGRRSNHSVENCRIQSRCYNCGNKHHTSLCQQPRNRPQENVLVIHSSTEDQVIQSTIRLGNSDEPINILYDSGSNKSYISKDASRRIAKFTGKTRNLSIDSFNGNRTNFEEVPIVVANLEKGDITLKVKAFEVEFIGRLSMANIPVEMQKTEQFMNIRENSGKPEIDVLIGADSYNDIVRTEGYRMIPNSNLMVIPTIFGSIVSGTVVPNNGNTTVMQLSAEEVWRNISSTGQTETENSRSYEVEFRRKLAIENTNNRYTVSLPFKNNSRPPQNLRRVMGRMKSTWFNQSESKNEFMKTDTTIKYCPSELNCADLPSRGVTRPKRKIEEWLAGPQWLLKEEDWPSQSVVGNGATAEQLSMNLVQADKPKENDTIDKLLSFAKWRTVIAVFQQVRRAIDRMTRSEIKTNTFERTERVLLQLLQQYYCSNEIDHLTTKKKYLNKRSSEYGNMNIEYQHGLISVVTRFSETEHHDGNLILIPHQSNVGNLILFEIHASNNHAGLNQLLYLFRQKYWMKKLRSKARSIIHECRHCRRVKRKRINQIEGPLPEIR
ncbi:hypothetical protein SNEBB_009223, partial [Seison nebaliae]